MKKFIFAIFLFIISQLMILYLAVKNLSAIQPMIPLSIPLSGPLAHFSAFFVTSFLLAMILTHKYVQIKYPFMISFAYSTMFAIIIELIQLKISYRYFSSEDMFIGMIGALTSCLIFRYSTKVSESAHNIFYT